MKIRILQMSIFFLEKLLNFFICWWILKQTDFQISVCQFFPLSIFLKPSKLIVWNENINLKDFEKAKKFKKKNFRKKFPWETKFMFQKWGLNKKKLRNGMIFEKMFQNTEISNLFENFSKKHIKKTKMYRYVF